MDLNFETIVAWTCGGLNFGTCHDEAPGAAGHGVSGNAKTADCGPTGLQMGG